MRGRSGEEKRERKQNQHGGKRESGKEEKKKKKKERKKQSSEAARRGRGHKKKKKRGSVAECEEEEAENRVGLLLCLRVMMVRVARQVDRPEAEKGTADRLATCSLECATSAATHHSAAIE